MDIRSYISNLVEKSIYPTMKMLFSASSDKIVDAINKKEQKVVNPADISEPIVAQIQALGKTVSESRVESIVVKNIADAKIDLSGLVQAFKDEIAKLDREVVVNQGDVNVDVSSVVKAIEKMEKSIPKMEKQEVIDYTLMFSQMMDIMEKPRTSEDVVEAITRLASQQGKDITLLAEWLKVIAEKEGEDFPNFKFDDDGRLLVNVNIRGGGGGGTSGGGATDVSALAKETTLGNLRDNVGLTTDAIPVGPDENGTISAKLRWLNTNQYQMMADTGDIRASLLGFRSDFQTHIATLPPVYIKKIDEALPYTYIGEANVAITGDAAQWRIKRIDDTNDPDSETLYAGTGAFDQVWDNRASLTYN